RDLLQHPPSWLTVLGLRDRKPLAIGHHARRILATTPPSARRRTNADDFGRCDSACGWRPVRLVRRLGQVDRAGGRGSITRAGGVRQDVGGARHRGDVMSTGSPLYVEKRAQDGPLPGKPPFDDMVWIPGGPSLMGS